MDDEQVAETQASQLRLPAAALLTVRLPTVPAPAPKAERQAAEGEQPAPDPKAAQAELDKAEELFAAESYREAAERYARLASASGPGGIVALKALQRLAQMEEMAGAHIRNADEAKAAGDPFKEYIELCIVVRQFPFTKVIAQARRRVELLQTMPEVAARLELEQAAAQEKAGELLRAAEAYRAIVRTPEYRATSAAREAQAKLAQIENSAAARSKLRQELQAQADREAPELLDLADQLIRNANAERAAEKLRLVIRKFPDTDYARKARRKLDLLP